jgi:hypothetical protein
MNPTSGKTTIQLVLVVSNWDVMINYDQLPDYQSPNIFWTIGDNYGELSDITTSYIRDIAQFLGL